MKPLDLDRLGRDYRESLDRAVAQRPKKVGHFLGIVVRKPYTKMDLDKIERFINAAIYDGMMLDSHETEGRTSIVAYHPVRGRLHA